ncbi:MAG: class I SAM-dependent methyltransferase [Pyrinomonadaceae bacterium]
MIRHLKPKRITEIGSGFSSCVMLDTNEVFFDNSISCTFIEPYPQLLISLMKEEDRKSADDVVASKLQDVDLSNFSALGKNDILFVDSTHISKVNSDVNYIFFELLPGLSSGVYIHFHDIFFPFEYPKEWIHQGRSWNEIYILRAFLQYNRSFKVALFNTFLEETHQEFFVKEMPLCMKNKGGSIWLQKI